ncbi:MAG: elongation factor G [Planctomycetaceae bacterium]|nr:elongation factor G [Planctomycetaceae bacterium]
MSRAIETIRNIGIIAHIDAGKTTTTERILYYSGASHSMGDVDHGNTTTDFDPEESARGITIYSAAVTCKWKDTTINIIDTPGHVDFTAEVERSLRVLDGGVVIFSAVEGVEAQSETVWRQADKYKVPRICFINKMDRIGAEFDRTLNEIKNRLHANPVPVVIPIGSGTPPKADPLTGVIDLIAMKALYFDFDQKGKVFREEEIPAAMKDDAELWRGNLIDAVTMIDDALMEKYLETSELTADEIRAALRTATIAGKIQPTLTGTSKNYMGVQPLLDAVTYYLPSPLDRPPLVGPHPNANKGEHTRPPTVEDPFAALVFKIVADQHADLCFLRIYSGKLNSGVRMLNPRTGKKELVGQLWHIQADSREKIEGDAAQKIEADTVEAGDIVGVVGLKEVVTGDTLCDPNQPILLESITFPEPVISMSVEPESSAERKKLVDVMQRLQKQDPTFSAKINEETGQTIISGMGELHLEIICKRMQRDFGVKVRVHKPRVSYRETIRDAVKVTGEFDRQLAGVNQFARVMLTVEPYEGTEPLVVENKMQQGKLPRELTAALEQSVMDEAKGGGIVGYPLMKMRFRITDVETRQGETTEVAIRAAAADAVRQSLQRGGIVLLEPVMKLEVVTPDEYLGSIQSDLNARRAMIVNTERRGPVMALEAHAPLSQMFGYSNQVRSLSQGRAAYSMEPLQYAPAPPDVLEAMMG